MDETSVEVPSWVKSVSVTFAGIVAAIGLLSFAGWVLDSSILKSVHPAFVTIKVNTAIGLILLGASVIVLNLADPQQSIRRITRYMPLVVALIGLLTVMEYILGVDLGIDQLLFKDSPLSLDTWSPGRMAAITAICFFFIGIAVHLIGEKYRRAKHLPDLLLFVTGLVGIFEIVGYLFDARALLALGMYGGMAVHTAFAILLISLGGLLTNPGERFLRPLISATPAGAILRWVLPVAILLPIAVVWIRFYGEQNGLYSNAVGAAVSVVVMISLFAIFSILGAHAIDRAYRNVLAVEKRARANDQRLRCLLNNAPVAMFMRKPDGKHIFANRSFELMAGAKPGMLEGAMLIDLYRDNPEKLAACDDIESLVLESGAPVEYEETVQFGNDRRKLLSTRFPTFDDNGVLIGIGGVSTDITELKRAQDNVDKLFSLATNLVCIADLNGYFVRVNPAWEKTFGFTMKELTGRPFMDFIHPDDIESTQRQYEEQAGGGEAISFENRYRCKDGAYRTLLWNATAANEDGLIFATAHDITSRKAIERQIAELNANLASRAAALEAANAELEAFSYSVSHDLRAPLRSIDGFSQALLEDYRGKLDATADDYLRRVSGAAQKMGHLIDDLLQLSRISRAPLRRATLDITAIARAANESLRELHPERAVNVTIEPDLTAVGDPGLIEVVLANLFSNAWKYTARKESATIRFGGVTIDGTPAFYIQDNGVGFDMAYATKLFGAFQRLHSANEFAGTGIGLATVLRIIRRHGGRVWAEGAVDLGAKFYFTLDSGQRETFGHERQMHSVS